MSELQSSMSTYFDLTRFYVHFFRASLTKLFRLILLKSYFASSNAQQYLEMIKEYDATF
jgi:hypothetical protein